MRGYRLHPESGSYDGPPPEENRTPLIIPQGVISADAMPKCPCRLAEECARRTAQGLSFARPECEMIPYTRRASPDRTRSTSRQAILAALVEYGDLTADEIAEKIEEPDISRLKEMLRKMQRDELVRVVNQTTKRVRPTDRWTLMPGVKLQQDGSDS